MREITVSLIGPEKVPKRGDPDRRVWRARYVDRQGRRRAQTIGDAREVSRVKAEKLVRQMERGFAADSTKVERLKRVTVAELVERYIAEKREGWTAKTLKANQEAAAHLLAAVSPRKLVRDFSVANAKAVVEHLRRPVERTRKVGRRQASTEKVVRYRRPLTIKKNLVVVTSMFTWAAEPEQRFIHANPFLSKPLREAKAKARGKARSLRAYTKSEVAALLDECPSWWATFVHLGLGSGMRLGEMIHLQWDDLDLHDGAGRVRVTEKERGEFQVNGERYPVLDFTLKSHQLRSIPIGNDVVNALRRLQAKSGGSLYVFLSLKRLRALGDRLDAGTLPDDFEPVNNTLTDFQRIQRRAFRRLRGHHNVGTIHDLRRTYGTTMAHRGVPMVVLKKLLGHSSMRTTEVYYLDHDSGWDDQIRSITPGKSDPVDPSSTLCPSNGATESADVVCEPASRYREVG